jgi:hypothetical protein
VVLPNRFELAAGAVVFDVPVPGAASDGLPQLKVGAVVAGAVDPVAEASKYTIHVHLRRKTHVGQILKMNSWPQEWWE